MEASRFHRAGMAERVLGQSPSVGAPSGAVNSLKRGMAPSASGGSLRGLGQSTSKTSLRGGLAASSSVTSIFSSTSDGPSRAMGPPQTGRTGAAQLGHVGTPVPSNAPSWVIEQVIDFGDWGGEDTVQEHDDCDSRLWRLLCPSGGGYDGCPKAMFS
eukprot:CAMPEP_0195074800 /NCGR_PEP_ID=MMETSP0448-20130528/17816_1 /TAXON_ID=66468 /ORGANISM="Heterocapsa triquestra, Strain CCMP 448" /LENGTH=156 /DNA_ID=CAMNT_0040107101 /DNA_START=35 /DNA_END=505 /DNA_ORIENTATION=+